MHLHLFVLVTSFVCPVTLFPIDNQLLASQTWAMYWELRFAQNGFVEPAFLFETSSASTLTIRQALSVESLAYRNQDLNIYVLMTGPVDNESLCIKTLVENYPNVFIEEINLDYYFYATPFHHWYFFSDWRNSKYHMAHLSDALRLLTLFKYGGYHFDLDIIHLRPVTSFRNFIVAEDEKSVANGVMHVGIGHPFIKNALDEFFSTPYDKNLWAGKGPVLVTKVLNEMCNTESTSRMTSERCGGFLVLPSSSFYPIYYEDWKLYFLPTVADNVVFKMDNAIGAHVWNHMSVDWPVRKKSNVLYMKLVRNSCPHILTIAPEQI